MNELAEAGVRMLDEAHLSWSLAILECEDALHTWRDAHPTERRTANLSYRAALDREEAAARDLERVTALVALTLEPNAYS